MTDGVVEGRSEREVRYRIRVGKEEYTHADVTGRTSLWTTLDDLGHAELARRGVVSVRYLPDDPRLNRPVHAVDAARGPACSGVCVRSGGDGGVLFAFGVRRVRRGRGVTAPKGF